MPDGTPSLGLRGHRREQLVTSGYEAQHFDLRFLRPFRADLSIRKSSSFLPTFERANWMREFSPFVPTDAALKILLKAETRKDGSLARQSSTRRPRSRLLLMSFLSEFLLSKMKIAVVVRQLDRGHILWCGRVVRVERAHRIRVVRGVQKMLDVGRHGVIEFGQIRFVAHDHVVTYVFRKDEFVGCCVAHHSARDIESLGKVWRSRSMNPAR